MLMLAHVGAPKVPGLLRRLRKCFLTCVKARHVFDLREKSQRIPPHREIMTMSSLKSSWTQLLFCCRNATGALHVSIVLTAMLCTSNLLCFTLRRRTKLDEHKIIDFSSNEVSFLEAHRRSFRHSVWESLLKSRVIFSCFFFFFLKEMFVQHLALSSFNNGQGKESRSLSYSDLANAAE